MKQGNSHTWRAKALKVISAFAIIAVIAVPAVIADPASPFTITNIDNPDPVASGAEVTYTITVVNTGGSKTTEVVLSDQLNGVGGIGVPPQLAITSSRGSCSQSATLVTCSAGTIEGGGTWTVTIRGVVIAANGTTLNNTASVTGTRSAQNFTSTATTSTLVSNGSTSQLPDLTITKNGPSTVGYGQAMTYTLIVNNQGLANATDVTVVDTLPAALGAPIIAQPLGTTSLFTCTTADHTVTCSGGAINQGANATITITGVAPSSDTTLTNTASVDPFNAIPESNELNNTSSLVNTQVMAQPPLPPLSITKVDATDPIVPGDTEVYTVTVKNNAATRADDVVIVDGTQGLEASTLTATFEVTDGTIGNFGGCSVAAPQAKCIARTLNPGGTIIMKVSGRVVASAGTTLLNTSTVTGNIKNTGYSATATEKTTVKPSVDLTVTVADSPDPVCARSWNANAGLPLPLTCRGGLEYLITPGNSGINAANNVVVRLPLPPGVVFDYITNLTAPPLSPPYPVWACSLDVSNVLTCTAPSIVAESIAPFKVMTVAPAVTGPISLTAIVDPTNAIFEADETNNTFTQATQVITGIDLTTKVVDDPPGFDPISTSGTQTYTITVWNEGTQDSTNIRLRDTLPSGTRFRDVIADPNHNFTCTYANGVIECVGGMLKGTASNNDPLIGGAGVNPTTPRDTATITIRIFAQSFAGTMHNEVRVDPLLEIPEANEANNIAVQDTVVGSFVDGHGGFNQLTIKKDQTYPLPVGSDIARNAKMTWEITVGNNGTDDAVGVTVRDFLPAGARYIEATGTNKFNCSQVGGHIDCVGGEIPPTNPAALPPVPPAIITISAFAPDTPAKYTNQAIVDPDGTVAEGNELDNEAQSQFTIKNGGIKPFYELSITSSTTDITTPRNAVVTYTVSVKNDGTDGVIGVVVRDTLPAGSRYIEATGDHQFLCTNSAGIVSCVGGQIASGDTATITIKMFAPDTPGDYINQAIVDPDNTIPEGDEENNRWQVKTIVKNQSAGSFNDLTIIKSAPSTVTPKGDLQYGLTVTNAGTDPALNVTVRDPLPADSIFVSATDNDPTSAAKFTCNFAGGVVNCTGATLSGTTVTVAGAPASRGITIHVTAPNTVIADYKNQAFVDPDNTIPEGDETNNSSIATTSVQPVINLSIKKDGPDTAKQSDVKDYTLTVKNHAPSGDATKGQTAFGVQVHDPLPVGLIPLAVDAGSGNNFGCQILQNPINVVDCVGDLNPEQEVTIKITVFVTAEDNRALDNEACVDPNNLIAEFDPGENDNCSTATMPVKPAPKTHPDLEVTKTASVASVTPGDSLTYTITVNNKGDAAANGTITVTDTLPSGLTVTSANGTGWTCNSTSPITCTKSDGLGMGDTSTIMIVASVSLETTSGFSNTAAAAQAQSDPSDTNAENEFVLDNNTSTVVTSVGPPKYDLAVAALIDNPDPAIRGQQLVYVINAANLGGLPANGVHLTLDLPSQAGVTLIDTPSGSNGWTCGATISNKIDCTGNLAAGASTAITAKFLVKLTAPADDLSFTATIDPAHAFAESAADQANNAKTVTTSVTGGGCTVQPCIDLAVAQFEGPASVAVNGTATYTFVLSNIGGAAAGPVNPIAWFDLYGDVSNVAPVSSNPAIIVCTTDSFSAGSYLLNSCNGTLQPGESVTLTLTVQVNSGTVVNAYGTADPGNLLFESSDFEPGGVCGNNCGQTSTTVTP